MVGERYAKLICNARDHRKKKKRGETEDNWWWNEVRNKKK